LPLDGENRIRDVLRAERANGGLHSDRARLAVGDRFRGIDHEVHHYLLNLRLVGPDERTASIQLARTPTSS
jgi:hypothetical protein